MDLLRLFASCAPSKVCLSLVLGALAGGVFALLIPIIMISLGHAHEFVLVGHTWSIGTSSYTLEALFTGACVVILVFRSLSQIMLSGVALDATASLRVKTYRRILSAPIAELERIGPSKLLVAITTDVNRIVAGAALIPTILVALVTVGGMLAYVYLLSQVVFWFVVKAIVFGVVTYQVPMLIGKKYFEKARDDSTGLQEAIRGLISGTKELKLNRVRSERYFGEILLAFEQAVLRNTKRANTIVLSAANYGDLLSFLVIGVIAYVLMSHHAVGNEQLIGCIMALLYISGPIGLVLNAMPIVANANVSLRNVNHLFEAMPVELAEQTFTLLPSWRQLRYSDITYRYEDAGHLFHLGPLDFEVERGKITFITGGNGSGKSTLAKIISLHYQPLSGDVHFGDLKIGPVTLNRARQHISAIFTDYYLFDRLLSNAGFVDQAMINGYLTRLGIAGKADVEQGKFSTLSLSDGQRRRLALLVAFVEDRDVYVFDEWAADQDPGFKEVFYKEILLELKRRDKAVVVVTHDDKYFHVADKVLMMEEGKLVKTVNRS
ncbi:cyclic peptide export ABC transporter [Dyella subtropica]|uniref:cyclic peptide export ABC transporter n=1 Tax=Dyella subtropica TaxID=2992127 RepID=UPI002250B476|nr:cyclic peptide export ABC transporter [Dyella subtropica]